MEIKDQMTVAVVDGLLKQVRQIQKKQELMNQAIFHLQNAVSKANPGTLSGEQWMDTIPYDERDEYETR
jgi:hypothetical protein